MSYSKIRSYAKINLALNVVGKSKFLHKIESIVGFINLYDEIWIRKIDNKNHQIKFIGQFSSNIKSNNTISLLLKNIDKKKLLKDKFQIIVKKNIPVESGLGGGSMNASSIINFLFKKKLIVVKKKEILKISKAVGSDVVLGLYSNSKSLLLKSNGIIENLPSKIKFYVLIVKPHFGCSTKKIYSKIQKFSKPQFYSSTKNILRKEFLKKLNNDLEEIAINDYPKMRILKSFLENLPDIEFVRMTGSGSAIIAYFTSVRKCKDAEKKVKKQFRNYWCKTSKTI